MKKPMVKALACALAFTMVATTPLSASASGIAGLYSTDEGTTKTATVTATETTTETKTLDGKEVTTTKTTTLDGKEVEKIEHRDENGNLNSTGTTTITTTNTNGLDSYEGGQENDKFIIGVHFDKEVIDLEAGEETGITAMVLFSDGTSMTADNFKDLLVFRKIQTKEEGQSLGAGSVAYADNYDWTAGGMDILTRDTLKVRGIHGGSFYIEAALKTDKSGEYKYFDVVAVNVKEYAESIDTVDEFAGYAKHTYSLADLGFTRETATSNDEISVTAYEIKIDRKGNRTEKSTSLVKVNKDNTFTIKDIAADKAVFVQAVSEKGKVATTQITTKEATPIVKMTYADRKVALNYNGWGNGLEKEVELVTSIKKNGATVEDTANETTDIITWTSKNNNVAKAANLTGKKNTIIATGTGKTVITAKSTSGKTVKFNVTVTSDLQEIKAIVDKNGDDKSTVYSGQKVQLTADKNPENATTKITWMSDNKTVAKVDKNGVVTANSKNKEGVAVITAKFVKKDSTGKKTTVTADVKYTLTVKKSELNADKLLLDDTYEIGGEDVKKDSLVKDKIYIPRTEDYNVTAQIDGEAAKLGDTKEVFDTNLLNNIVTWTNSKAKVVSLDDDANAKALTAGKTNITASVVNAKGVTLKAKATITSTQAVTALQTNKTVVNVSLDKKGDIKPVTLKVAKQLPKNATKETLTWDKAEGSESIDFTASKNGTKSATAKVTFANAQVGDSATFTVRAANGATSTVVVNVVNPTTKVEFRKDGVKVKGAMEAYIDGEVVANLNEMATIISGKGDAAATVKAGTEGYENVEFSVNKKGIVTIDKDGNVYAVKKGTVKITAKTPAGKKAVMTIKVK